MQGEHVLTWFVVVNLHLSYTSSMNNTRLYINNNNDSVSTTLVPYKDDDIRMKYCYNRSAFMESFVIPDISIPFDMVKFMANNCNHTCYGNKEYAFFTLNTQLRFKTGIFDIPSDNDCWRYYYEIRSRKDNNAVIFHQYVTNKDLEKPHTKGMTSFEFMWNETKANRGDIFTIRMVAIPGGDFNNIERGYPESDCHKFAYQRTVDFYWKKIELQGECEKYFDEWNIFTMSSRLCSVYHKNIETGNQDKLAASVNSSVWKYMVFDRCNVYLKEEKVTVTGQLPRYQHFIWLAALLLSIVLVILAMVKCYMSRKQSGKNCNLQTNRLLGSKVDSHEKIDKVMLPPNDDVSIMILHRPGCDHLDSFVRDLSFIVHSYNVRVTSPLLEMSNIDAEGGIASYIQRNIDLCTYILVLVTDNPTTEHQEIQRLNRPFEFSMKILSGLAFRENETSRFIPIYLKEYRQIVAHIPPFLTACRAGGFQVPAKLKELIDFVKQETGSEEPKQKKDKLQFFSQKLKSQAKMILRNSHKNCHKQQCFQGELNDDASVLWAGDSSVCTRHTAHHGMHTEDRFPDQLVHQQQVDNQQKQLQQQQADNDMDIFFLPNHNSRSDDPCCPGGRNKLENTTLLTRQKVLAWTSVSDSLEHSNTLYLEERNEIIDIENKSLRPTFINQQMTDIENGDGPQMNLNQPFPS